ncbi:hypothetical protein Droror1_Dr00011899 [Drosera rotundifolia]
MNSFNNMFNNQRNTTQNKEYNQSRRAITTSFLHVFFLFAVVGLQLVINGDYNEHGRGDEVAKTGYSSLLHRFSVFLSKRNSSFSLPATSLSVLYSRCFFKENKLQIFLCVHCFC